MYFKCMLKEITYYWKEGTLDSYIVQYKRMILNILESFVLKNTSWIKLVITTKMIVRANSLLGIHISRDKNANHFALACLSQELEHRPADWKVSSSIPIKGIYLSYMQAWSQALVKAHAGR